MCIKLTCHFHGSATVCHSIGYLVRCSNPVFSWEELLESKLLNQGCLDELDEREEAYDLEACPDCSGEMPHPRRPPSSTTAGPSLSSSSSSPTRGDVFAHPESVGRASAVSVYAQNLARWLFAYMHGALTKRYASVLHVDDNVLRERENVLDEDVRMLLMQCYEELVADHQMADPEEGHEEDNRFIARASLVPWACFLLARDPGLSLERARKIPAFFIARVVKYDPARETHNLRDDEMDCVDFCRRLAHVANRHPERTKAWAIARLGRFARTKYTRSMRLDQANWHWRDRARSKFVERNVLEADDAQLAALRERDEAKCAICLESFDDHNTAPGFDRPVQNRLCAKRGCSHWCARACLVRFARTRQGVNLTAPDPRCPICRTEFPLSGGGATGIKQPLGPCQY